MSIRSCIFNDNVLLFPFVSEHLSESKKFDLKTKQTKKSQITNNAVVEEFPKKPSAVAAAVPTETRQRPCFDISLIARAVLRERRRRDSVKLEKPRRARGHFM